MKPAPTEQEIHGPLEKVTSLLHPITSSESSVFRRSRSRKSGGEEDSEKMHEDIKEEKGDGSEESWDVVSNDDQSQSHSQSLSHSNSQSTSQSHSHSFSLGNPLK